MKTRTAVLPLSILLALAILVPGQVQAGKLYVGANAGLTSADITLSDIDDGSITGGTVDDSDSGYKAFVGFRLLKFLALEADWIDVGEVTIAATSDGTGTDYVAGPVMSTAAVDGYRLSALGIVPLGKRFSVLARYGYFDWDSTFATTDGAMTITDSDSGEDDFYGVGVAVKFKIVSLRVEYEMMTVDGNDVELASAGLALRF